MLQFNRHEADNENRPWGQLSSTGKIMGTLSLTDILDDLRAAEDGLHKFERRYWISSEQFIELYGQGLLDDGDHLEDFAEWAGHYRLRQKRQAALKQISMRQLV